MSRVQHERGRPTELRWAAVPFRSTAALLRSAATMLLLLSLAAFSGCTSPDPPSTTSGPDLPAVRPDDFSFVAAYGPYGRNVIDTFNGTFTKDSQPDQTQPDHRTSAHR